MSDAIQEQSNQVEKFWNIYRLDRKQALEQAFTLLSLSSVEQFAEKQASGADSHKSSFVLCGMPN